MSLIAVGILELDSNGDLLLTASHPSISDDELEVLKSRSGLIQGKESLLVPFVCSRYENQWHYIQTTNSDALTRASLPFVDRLSVCVIAKDFNPEKYHQLSKVILTAHTKTGSSVYLMKIFVDVTVKKSYEDKDLGLSYREDAFDPRRALISSPLKGIIETFPEDFGLLWLAMALKRRIFVIASSADEALQFVRAMPLLVWHRSNWGLLRPIVTSTAQEVKDLEQAGIFCAGVIGDDNPIPRKVSHDLLVNVSERTITTTESGKDILALSGIKLVKDIVANVREAANSANDQDAIKALATKMKELLAQIIKLKQNLKNFNVEELSNLQPALPQHMPHLVFSLAMAEGLCQ